MYVSAKTQQIKFRSRLIKQMYRGCCCETSCQVFERLVVTSINNPVSSLSSSLFSCTALLQNNDMYLTINRKTKRKRRRKRRTFCCLSRGGQTSSSSAYLIFQSPLQRQKENELTINMTRCSSA